MKLKKSFKGVKIIWQYLKPYKKRVYFIAFIAIIGSIISASIPYLYGRLVDIAVDKSSTIQIIGEILLLWLILSLVGDWMSRFVNDQGFGVALDASDDLLIGITGHVLDLPLSFHKNKKMGKIVQRVVRAADFLERIIYQVVFYIGSHFLTAISSLTIMMVIEWRLGITLFGIVILYIAVSVWKTDPIVKSQKMLNRRYESAYGDLYDSVGNIQTVKSCTRENLEKKKTAKNFHQKVARLYKSFMGLWRNVDAWQSSITGFGFMLVFSLALFFLQNNTISTGQFVMFVGYVAVTFQPLGALANNYRLIKTGLTVIERAEALKKVKPEPYDEKRRILKDVKGEVEFDMVSFSYSKKQKVLIDISFKAKQGEMVALVGESGVGKSTLVDLISGYYMPEKGKISIDGQDISKVNLRSLRENIAVVPQEVSLFNDTVINNIRYGNPKATDEEIISAAKTAHAHKFIQKFPKKYQQIVGERGIKLSTGQKQRVAIARALLRNPKILILDEATASLDSATEKLVQDALQHLIKGRTTFVIAHRLSTIQKADQILVLEKGRIIEEGDHQELIEKGGVYKKLSELQSTVLRG